MTFLINPKLPRTSLTARYWLSIEELIVQSFRFILFRFIIQSFREPVYSNFVWVNTTQVWVSKIWKVFNTFI